MSVVRFEVIIDLGDVVTIAHRFPPGTTEAQADEWIRLKGKVRSEAMSRMSQRMARRTGVVGVHEPEVA